MVVLNFSLKFSIDMQFVKLNSVKVGNLFHNKITQKAYKDIDESNKWLTSCAVAQ